MVGEGTGARETRGTESEGPQLGSVTHWHYWYWADGGSGFQFSFSTDTRAPGKPPGVGIWMQWEGPWHVRSTPGPGSTVDLLGD